MASDPNTSLAKTIAELQSGAFSGASAIPSATATGANRSTGLGSGLQTTATSATATGANTGTATGYSDGTLAGRVAEIVDSNSPLMKQARTTGLQSANRRGLANSSIALGEMQKSSLDAAVPIASQEWNDKLQRELQDQKIEAEKAEGDANRAAQKQIAQMNLAGEERRAIASAITDMTSNRFNAISNTLNNPDISSSARNQVISSINAQFDGTMNYIQNLYGVSLSDVTPAK